MYAIQLITVHILLAHPVFQEVVGERLKNGTG